MKRVVGAVVLPPEITTFEREYLRKMNRVALVFFALHVPLFTIIAFFNGTGPVAAALLTLLGVGGPWLAQRVFSNPRAISTVFGVTAMFMGALLVHFGRGLWTIEMHFYFFVALALLAVFANPMVIIVATVTVATHHFVLWFIAPQSVFNYDAPLTSVLVHALFVVVEAVAATFVARSFFDNVIGLERIVAARTNELDGRNREMQLVFDHVNQGFLTVDAAGALAAQHSKVVENWFKAPVAGQPLWDFFSAADPAFGQWLRLGWDTVEEGLFPLDVALAQLPSTMQVAGKHLSVEYQPVCNGEKLAQVLVLVTDVTEKRAREAADVAQRETMAVFEKLMRDRAGFLDFFSEAKELVGQIDNGSQELIQRRIHTLKGNCALFGMSTVSDACHLVETRIAERGNSIESEDFGYLRACWARSTERVLSFLEAGRADAIELDESDYASILQAIDRGAPRAEVLHMIESWRHEPVKKRFERMSEQARAIAARLGKPSLEVVIDAASVRLPRDRFAPIWATATHLLRNAIDHGVNSNAATTPRIDLSARVSGGELHLTIADNGAGIDWDEVASQAKQRGLAAGTRAELTEALFTNGLSTRSEATETSGRGVGMGAVRDSVRQLGGSLSIHSEKGLGTKIDLVFPATTLEAPRSAKVDELHALAGGAPRDSRATS